MNNTFSSKRFKQQLTLDLHRELAQMLLLIALVVGVCLCAVLYFIYFFRKPGILDSELETIFSLAYLFSAFFFCGSLFSGLREKSSSMGYLMIPSSVVEKYLSSAFLVLIFNGVGVLLYFILVPSIVYLFDTYNDELFFVHQETPTKFLIAVIFGLIVQPIFFFGSFSFKKFPAIKTGLCLGVFLMLCVLMASLCSHNQVLISLDLRRFYEYKLGHVLSSAYPLVFLLFLLLTFLRLKEKEA